MRTRKKQGLLEFRTRGGKRRGAGRKPAPGRKPCVSHHGRAAHTKTCPLHVTLRVREDVPSLRSVEIYLAIENAIRAGNDRFGFRAIEFSVITNHLHFIVEAESRRALSRGMQGLTIRIAKAINRILKRTGKVFADRFQSRELTTPTEVRNALLYVLNNAKHHTNVPPEGWVPRQVDPFSSAKWFPGWDGPVESLRLASTRPGAEPRTWLLRTGWKRLGLLSPQAVPRPHAQSSRRH